MSENIRVTLGETAKEEGELVCYLVDSPRNACYCIFVTFAWAGTHSVYMVTLCLALRHLRAEGEEARGQEMLTRTPEVFVSIKETKTERQTKPNVLCFETQFKNSISFQIILLF